MASDLAISTDAGSVSFSAPAGCSDTARPGGGTFEVLCTDADGNEVWREVFRNVWTQAGKLHTLSNAIAGATAYAGLVSSGGTPAAADTMGSHSGWTELSLMAARGTTAWGSAATSGAANAQVVLNTSTLAITSAGTIGGVFVVCGTGASATIANTGGTLICAGTLTTAQPVISSNTVTVSYTLTI